MSTNYYFMQFYRRDIYSRFDLSNEIDIINCNSHKILFHIFNIFMTTSFSLDCSFFYLTFFLLSSSIFTFLFFTLSFLFFLFYSVLFFLTLSLYLSFPFPRSSTSSSSFFASSTSSLFVPSGTICSNNGDCKYRDPSRNVLPVCSILDITCTASCVCHPDFGGADCSLDSASFSIREFQR